MSEIKKEDLELISRDQFNHICNMLKAHGLPVDKENIVRYLKKNKNQLNRLTKNMMKSKENYALQMTAYMQDIYFKFKLFGYWFVVYKYGTGRGFGSIVKSNHGDKNGKK